MSGGRNSGVMIGEKIVCHTRSILIQILDIDPAFQALTVSEQDGRVSPPVVHYTQIIRGTVRESSSGEPFMRGKKHGYPFVFIH